MTERKMKMGKSRRTIFVGIILAMLVCMMAIPSYAAKLNKTKATLAVGQTLKLKVKNAGGSVRWSSSKRSVATVSNKGVVTAKKKGSAQIRAVINGKTYKCSVKVKNNIFVGTDYNNYADPKIGTVVVDTKVIKAVFVSKDRLDVTLALYPENGDIFLKTLNLKLCDNNGTAFFDGTIGLTNPVSVKAQNQHNLTIRLSKKEFPSMRVINLTSLREDKFVYWVDMSY